MLDDIDSFAEAKSDRSATNGGPKRKLVCRASWQCGGEPEAPVHTFNVSSSGCPEGGSQNANHVHLHTETASHPLEDEALREQPITIEDFRGMLWMPLSHPGSQPQAMPSLAFSLVSSPTSSPEQSSSPQSARSLEPELSPGIGCTICYLCGSTTNDSIYCDACMDAWYATAPADFE